MSEQIGFITPENIVDQMNTTNELFTTLNGEIWASKARDVFKAAWKTFYTGWLSFYQSNQGFWSNLFGSEEKLNKAKEYQGKVEAWEKAFRKETGSGPVGPSFETPSKFNWKLAGYAILGIGALIGIGYAVNAFGGATREVRGFAVTGRRTLRGLT